VTPTTGRGLSITSPDLIFTSDGKHCYAYSGEIRAATANTEYTFLLFTTTKNPIKGGFDFGYTTRNNNANGTMIIYFNDTIVFQCESEGSELKYFWEPILIIPENTTVKVTLQTDATNLDLLAKFIGRPI